MTPADKKRIFATLKTLLKKHGKGPVTFASGILSDAGMKGDKRQAHLKGKKSVSILNRPERQTDVVGIIEQKNFVGFYSMPMYSHPKKMSPKHPELKRAKKGKSCLNITRLDPGMLKELDSLIRRGILIYKKQGWI